MELPEIITLLESVSQRIADDRFGCCDFPRECDGGECASCCFTENTQFDLVKAITELKEGQALPVLVCSVCGKPLGLEEGVCSGCGDSKEVG